MGVEMRIGIIQTRGIGDIVIAAPIAMYYIAIGYEVCWPIDSEFLNSFSFAFPKIEFIPVDKFVTGENTAEYFYDYPLSVLKAMNCEKIFCLYSHLTGFDFGNNRIQNSLPFDAYKYAVAGVPFKEKWNFHPRRNIVNEANLFKKLNLDPCDSYVLTQEQGSNFNAGMAEFIEEKNVAIINITPITDNIFDWIGVIESSKAIYAIDSVFVNIIDQLHLSVKKSIYLRSKSPFTPILLSNWRYI